MLYSPALLAARALRPSSLPSQLLVALGMAAVSVPVLLSLGMSRSSNRSRINVPCTTEKECTAAPKYRWGAFVSYDPLASFSEAQWLQNQLKDQLSSSSIYVDTAGDDTYDANATADHILNSKVFILLQTKGIYKSPHRLFEVVTALKHGIPLVMVAIDSGLYLYDIGVESLQLREQLASTVDARCLNFLAVHGYPAFDALHMIARIIPSLISIKLDITAPCVVRMAMADRVARVAKQVTPCPLNGATMVYSPSLQRRPSTPRALTPRRSQMHANMHKLVPISDGSKRPKIEGAEQRFGSYIAVEVTTTPDATSAPGLRRPSRQSQSIQRRLQRSSSGSPRVLRRSSSSSPAHPQVKWQSSDTIG